MSDWILEYFVQKFILKEIVPLNDVSNALIKIYIYYNQYSLHLSFQEKSYFFNKGCVCVCVCVCVCAQSLQSGPTLCDPMDYSPPVSSVNRDSPGKNTGVGCHTLFQGILPTLLLSVACFWHNLVLVILYGSSRMGLCNHSWRGLINSWLKEWMNRDWTHMPCIARQILNHWTICEDPLKCHLHCELVL